MIAEFFTSLWVDTLLFQSWEDYSTAIETGLAPRVKCVYVGNGINFERFRRAQVLRLRSPVRAELGYDDSDYVVGFVGRFVREKGILDLLKAVRRLGPTVVGRQIRLLLVGEGEVDQRDSLSREELSSWGAGLDLRVVGWRPDPERYYPAMDVFVLPSYREGISRSLMEACAAGVPVIATDIRGNREVVVHGLTGLLYPLGEIDSLVECLRDIAVRRDPAWERAEAGQEHIRRFFHKDLVAERLKQVYDGLWRRLAQR